MDKHHFHNIFIWKGEMKIHDLLRMKNPFWNISKDACEIIFFSNTIRTSKKPIKFEIFGGVSWVFQ